MKGIIVYFSLTGNTKKVARAIQKGMNPFLESCDLVKLKDVDSTSLCSYDLIGIGSAVWGGPPKHLEWFIDSLPDLSGKYIFAFSTHGARGGRFFPVLLKLLRKKGLKVIGVRDWYGSVFLPMMPKPYLTDGHPDPIDLAEAQAFGKEIAELRLRIEAEGPRAVPPLPKMPLLPASRLKRPRPKLDRAKCSYPACTLCMDYCPVNGIDLNVTPPVFGRNCHTCHFCEMICPEGAVSVDYDSFVKKGHRRGKSVYAKNLEEGEAAGTFRRLVPIEDVHWDVPYYKKFERHPRYVIPDKD
jgi:flavodoxin/ferredoxin